MSKQSPLKNVFKVDKQAQVVPIKVAGHPLSDPPFAGLLFDPWYRKVEGRGTYQELKGEAQGRHRYVKGAGNTESLQSEWSRGTRARKGELGAEFKREFPQFGHRDLRKIFFGSAPSSTGATLTGPKVRGALALPYAIAEVLNAEVFLRLMMIKEKIGTRDEAKAKGLTVPEGVIKIPTISAEISEAIAKANELSNGVDSPATMIGHHYGLAALTVPAAERLRTRADCSKGLLWRRVFASESKMQMVGRVLKHQLECGFVSLSTHLQNVYNAPTSLCPHADNSDLVPISEILLRGVPAKEPQKPYICALVMRQLQYLPFNLTACEDEPDLQLLARIAVQIGLETVAPGLWTQDQFDRLISDYQRKPFSVLLGVAERLINEGIVTYAPPGEELAALWSTLRSEYADYGYSMITDVHIHRALHDAITNYAALQNAEERGGIKPGDISFSS